MADGRGRNENRDLNLRLLRGRGRFGRFRDALGHHEGIEAILVIARDGLEDEITEAFIKGDGGGIVDGDLEDHGVAAG